MNNFLHYDNEKLVSVNSYSKSDYCVGCIEDIDKDSGKVVVHMKDDDEYFYFICDQLNI